MSQPSLDTLIGHSDHGNGPQTLREHLSGVARRAEAFAASIGGAPFARWLGWWHDAGKVASDVQDYLLGKTDLKQGPDHSSAGMLEAWDVAPFLANIIAGHHSGLDDADQLKERVKKKQVEQRVTEARSLASVLLEEVVALPDSVHLPSFLRRGTRCEQLLRLAFWQRMLHSALIDADRLDAEAHGNPENTALREAEPISFEVLCGLLETDQIRLITRAESTPVNQVRAEIYQACLNAADMQPGFFSLTVPTGGGKTRSVLAFGLRHAARYGLRRVILTLPYTTIIEQNAAVYRKILGPNAVLDHHSAVYEPERKRGEENDEAERKITLAAENWEAPIVVTTTVQLFESLFSVKNSRLRKLHRIARSVIVLDEAQTLPPELLVPTLEALRYLVEDYGCTVVFCTATQPAFGVAYGDPYKAYFAGFRITEIIPDPASVYKKLARVNYEVATDRTWSWNEAAREMLGAPQALAIVNTVKDAEALFSALDDPRAFHLSTRLCPAHRRRVLAKVLRLLKDKERVYLVSTQLIEAGVDISFPLVLRALGPLDSLIQAAGRCNREGEMPVPGRVVVFQPSEGGMPPGAYKAGTDQTRNMIKRYEESFPKRLQAPELPMEYFQRLYGMQNLDAREILNCEKAGQLKESANRYRFIEETVSVVVSYDTATDESQRREEVIARIRSKGMATRSDWRMLQPFTVHLRKSDFDRAIGQGLSNEVGPGVWEWVGAYDGDLRGRGLGWQWDPDRLIF